MGFRSCPLDTPGEMAVSQSCSILPKNCQCPPCATALVRELAVDRCVCHCHSGSGLCSVHTTHLPGDLAYPSFELGFLTKPAAELLSPLQDGGSLDQVLKEAKRIPEDILGKVSIAVSSLLLLLVAALSWEMEQAMALSICGSLLVLL